MTQISKNYSLNQSIIASTPPKFPVAASKVYLVILCTLIPAIVPFIKSSQQFSIDKLYLCVAQLQQKHAARLFDSIQLSHAMYASVPSTLHFRLKHSLRRQFFTPALHKSEVFANIPLHSITHLFTHTNLHFPFNQSWSLRENSVSTSFPKQLAAFNLVLSFSASYVTTSFSYNSFSSPKLELQTLNIICNESNVFGPPLTHVHAPLRNWNSFSNTRSN